MKQGALQTAFALGIGRRRHRIDQVLGVECASQHCKLFLARRRGEHRSPTPFRDCLEQFTRAGKPTHEGGGVEEVLGVQLFHL